MTEWDEMLDQTLRRYANPPTPDGLEKRILARVEGKSRHRILLIFAPLATACAAAIVAAVMLLHQAPARRQVIATGTVTNTQTAAASTSAARTGPSRQPRSRAVQRPADANAIATSPAPVFPVPLPLTAEERRMQALAQDGAAIVQPEDSELVISKLDIQIHPLESNDPTNQGAENEQTEP